MIGLHGQLALHSQIKRSCSNVIQNFDHWSVSVFLHVFFCNYFIWNTFLSWSTYTTQNVSFWNI